MIRDRELQKVAGDSFVTENGARVFDGRANIKVTALGIVGGDEIKARIVFVVNAGRVHETAGTGGLERFGQLANFKAAEIARQRDEMILFQETNHLSFAALVGFQKVVLIFQYNFRARRVGIGKRRIGQHRFETTITRELGLAEHLDLCRIERQKLNRLEETL